MPDSTPPLPPGYPCGRVLVPPPDPLRGLSPRDYDRVAALARAELLCLVPPATAALLRRGRCRRLLEHRMRRLLSGPP